MCRLNAKFALAKMSRTRLQIILLVLFKSNLRSGSIYTPVSRDSDAFRRLVVKV